MRCATLSVVRWTPNELVTRADKVCVAVHFLAWLVVTAVWIVNWHLNGPSPSGPLFNFAFHFIGRIDYVVKAIIDDLTIRIAQTAASWFTLDLGASFTLACASLLLIGGTLQWFLLGKLVQWTAEKKGITAGLSMLAIYAIWIGASVFLWVAA
jgi:hypothetical protein